MGRKKKRIRLEQAQNLNRIATAATAPLAIPRPAPKVVVIEPVEVHEEKKVKPKVEEKNATQSVKTKKDDKKSKKEGFFSKVTENTLKPKK